MGILEQVSLDMKDGMTSGFGYGEANQEGDNILEFTHKHNDLAFGNSFFKIKEKHCNMHEWD